MCYAVWFTDHDQALKARIRRLRVYSRVLGFIISVGVFVPIALTVHKFLTTQNIYRDVLQDDGTIKNRTAWAKESKVWPTWMYFVVAGISLALNLLILVAYAFGVDKANLIASVSTAFSWTMLLGNLVVWCIAASLYRTEKDKDNKSNDLWGWTCSPAARKIQKEFAGEIDFNRYCDIQVSSRTLQVTDNTWLIIPQSISWYIGLVQVGAALLTVVTYVFVFIRKGKKKEIKRRHSQMPGQYPTNY